MEGLFNRRYLRVKVMQAIYAYDSANQDLETGEKMLVKSLDEVYDLYIQMLSLLLEVVEVERRSIERGKEKRIKTELDINPNSRFAQNEAAVALENNKKFKLLSEKINWNIESDTIIKIWREVKEDKKYKAFMSNPEKYHNFQQSVEILIYIFKNYIAVNEVFLDLFEERNIHWYDDVQLVSINVVKTLSALRPGAVNLTEVNSAETELECVNTELEKNIDFSPSEVLDVEEKLRTVNEKWDEQMSSSILMPLFKNLIEDLKFVKELYVKTILQSDDSMKLIEKYTTNWDVERIARLDVVIMKIAITEFVSFPSIPVKVTINEYLEIAKNYSTDKSRIFINGILDKVLVDLKTSGKMNKSGLGLINR